MYDRGLVMKEQVQGRCKVRDIEVDTCAVSFLRLDS